MQKPCLSMRLKIILLMSFIIFSLCFVSIIQEVNSTSDLMKNMEHILESESYNLGNSIASQFYERYGDVQEFALNPVFQQGDKQKMQETLNQYASLYGIYDLIIFADINGNFIISNSLDPKGKAINYQKLKQDNYSKEKWFENVVNKKITEDLEKKFQGTYFEGPYEDPITSKAYGIKAFGNTFSAPVYNKYGKIIGVLSNRTNFSYIEDELKETYTRLAKQGYSSSELCILDINGNVITEHDPSFTKSTEYKRDFSVLNKLNLFKRNPERATYFKEKKNGIYYSFHPRKNYETVGGFSYIESPKWISSTGWIVLVRSEVNTFFSQINYLKYKFIFTILLIGFIFIFIAFLFINSLCKKFIQISEHLKLSAAKTFTTANKMALSSEEVATATADQSEAVQQSVSAMSIMPPENCT